MNRHTRPSRWSVPLLLAAAVPALAAEYRYAERPVGLDSPAGRCVVCHSVEQGGPFRVAPNLYGIVGAEKARDRERFNYSRALLDKGGTWSEKDLDAFLANAGEFAPGSNKSIRVADADARREIIDALKRGVAR